MSDISYLSNIISETHREFSNLDVLRHLDEGGTLTAEQLDRATKLNNYANNTMDGLISSIKGLGAMMFYAAMYDKDGVESVDAANTAWLVSILGDLVQGVHLLESDTNSVLSKSQINAIKAASDSRAHKSDITR